MNFDEIDKNLLAVSDCKIIHQVWFNFADPGNVQPVPDEHLENQSSWVQMNPGWQYMLWQDDMADALVSTHYSQFWELYNSFEKPVMKTDFARFCFLHRYGGIYADMDTRCQKPMDDLIKAYPQPAGFANDVMYTLCNCFMLSMTRNNPIWLTLIEGAEQSLREQQNKKKVLHITGPAMLYKKLIQETNDYEFVVYPTSIVYWDKPFVTTARFWKSHSDSKSAFVIHYSDLSWNDGIAATLYKNFGKSVILFILIIMLIVVLVMLYRYKDKSNLPVDVHSPIK